MECKNCENYKPKEEYIEGDVFLDEYNSTQILTYVDAGSFSPLYEK